MRFVEGSPIDGSISFVGLSAEAATRTYKVEALIANPDATIADGLTCEMSISLEPIEAAAIPRSSLVFSDNGELGVRTVDAAAKVRFVEVDIVDDQQASVWVTGLDGPADVIVVGSHGRHGIALLLGSTANGVLHGATTDVLAVRVGPDAPPAD